MQIPGVHIETLHNPVRYTYAQIEKACAIAADAEPRQAGPRRAAAAPLTRRAPAGAGGRRPVCFACREAYQRIGLMRPRSRGGRLARRTGAIAGGKPAGAERSRCARHLGPPASGPGSGSELCARRAQHRAHGARAGGTAARPRSRCARCAPTGTRPRAAGSRERPTVTREPSRSTARPHGRVRAPRAREQHVDAVRRALPRARVSVQLVCDEVAREAVRDRARPARASRTDAGRAQVRERPGVRAADARPRTSPRRRAAPCVSRSGATPADLGRPTCDACTWRPPTSRTSRPKAAGARPPMFAATSCSPSNSRARSRPPYGNARWLTGDDRGVVGRAW